MLHSFPKFTTETAKRSRSRVGLAGHAKEFIMRTWRSKRCGDFSPGPGVYSSLRARSGSVLRGMRAGLVGLCG